MESNFTPVLPDSLGKTSKGYEVDRGHHTESYITAIRGNTIPAQLFSPKKPESEMIPVNEMDNDAVLPPVSSPLMGNEFVPLNPQPKEKVGYSVAELERYRNDPFWKTLRWLLFILFWLLWIVMFLAAILIVIFSPSCAPKIMGHWWQNAIVYQIWTPSFQDSDGNGVGDFAGVTSRLENLRRLGVQAVWLTPFLHSDGFNDAIRNHLEVDPKLGVNEDAYELIDASHNKGMKVMITLPVGITSKEHDWYYRSAQASLPEYANFSDYYHWREPREVTSFMSKYKNVSYIHYENQPDWPVLNWQSASVRQNMFDIMSYWIDKDIDGFYLSGIEYLSRVSFGSKPSWPDIKDILRDIRNHVDIYAKESPVAKDKQIVLYASRDNAREDEKKELVLSGLNTIINYELGTVAKDSKICHRAEGNVAGCVHEILSDLVQYHTANDIPAMWEFGNPQLSRVASRVQSQKQAELLLMIQLLLPGTNSIYYGDEIGMLDLPASYSVVPAQRGAMQWDDSPNAGFSNAPSPNIPVNPNFSENTWVVVPIVLPQLAKVSLKQPQKEYGSSRSQLKTLQKLARLRQRDEILGSGQTVIGQLVGSAFAIIRYRDDQNNTNGNLYLGAFNFGSNDAKISIQEMNAVKDKKLDLARIVVSSSNAEQYQPHHLVDLSSGILTMSPEQGVVFKLTD